MIWNNKRDAWIAGLKVGDRVAISHGSWDRSYTFATVTRTSDATIWVGGHRKFWRRGRKAGDLVGAGPYTSCMLYEPTQEMVDAANERQLRACVRDMKLGELSREQIARIVAIIDEVAP
jgi:hypothetical protein